MLNLDPITKFRQKHIGKFLSYWRFRDGVNEHWNEEMETLSRVETWPQNFKPTLIGDSKFFEIDESLLVALAVKVHVKKKGYKDLDNLLENHGKDLSSVKKVRAHMVSRENLVSFRNKCFSRRLQDSCDVLAR